MEKESNAYGVYHNNQFFPSLSDFKFREEEISHLSLKDQILFNQLGSRTRLRTLFNNVLDAFKYLVALNTK